MKNRSDEPIFHSQGLSRSASNLAESHRRIRLREILLACLSAERFDMEVRVNNNADALLFTHKVRVEAPQTLRIASVKSPSRISPRGLSAKRFDMEVKMKKKADGRLRKKASYLALALIMAAGLSACGSGKEPQPAAEQTVETAEAQAAEEAAKEAAEKEAAEKEAAAKEAAEKEAAEQEAIKKPEPAAEEAADDKGKENKKKENKKEADKDNSEALALLDGKMTFDGMELEFPIELDGMKLGNWKIEYHGVDDPDSKMLAPAEIVTAVMTNDVFTADDVTVTAEFGNYTDGEVALKDLPMTGIYISKGKGKDGKEPVLPEVIMPAGLTWGSKAEEIRDIFGEASLSGSFFDKDFDYMYENGNYLVEFGGMSDTGLEYIVYCVE